MAAAARRGESDAALKEIRNRLAALQSEIRSPSELEKNIERIRRSHMRALTKAATDYESTMPDLISQAAEVKIQNLEYAMDAFYDYVQHREDHESHEHVIGRAQVAQYLRDTLKATIKHFGRP